VARQNYIEWTLRVNDEATRKLQEVDGELGEVGDASDDTSDSVDGLGSIVSAARGIFAAFAAKELAQSTIELARLGAEAQRTERAFANISGGAMGAQENLEAMRRATRGAVDDTTLMNQANRLLQMGLADNASELEDMTTMAVRLGTAMGRDASQSIEEFALLLANQSIPRLDTFGISAGQVRTRIAELQEATAGLSREQAFLQAVQEQGTVAMERLGPATEDAALEFERTEANLRNLKTSMGELASEITGPAVGAFNQLLQSMVEVRREADEVEAIFGEEMVASARALESRGLGPLGTSFSDLEEAAARVREVSGNTALSMYEAARAGRDLSGASGDAAANMWDLEAAGGEVAQRFGELTFDNQTLWELAMASGASAESLGILAQQLGIATEEEVQNTLETQRLIEAYGAGEITAAELEAGFDRLATTTLRQRQEAARASGEIDTMRGGMIEADGAARDLEGSAGGVARELGEVGEAARVAQEKLSQIEREINVDVFYKEHGQRPTGAGAQVGYQTGTDFVPRDMTAFLHRGEAVLNPREAAIFRAARVDRSRRTQNNFSMTVHTTAGSDEVIRGFETMRALIS
jgi:hypothetical protein